MLTQPMTGERLARRGHKMCPSALRARWLEPSGAVGPAGAPGGMAGGTPRPSRDQGPLARLAKGYTTLIPKKGPPGRLNTRPLTVYRLWVQVRLEEVIAWRESWAHPLAFGFRPARKALDGAALTHPLLELCRLNGWTLAEPSINYKKCFNLIPQVVVLQVAAELSMAPAVYRALGAMYQLLRRAFKLAGCPGQWRRATNGILQECRLSVLLVNASMGI